ncbi:hypothetical protein A3I18_02705 [Candidatus Campbellbacteria bacterium RIFCSPLOWO2_02_FULL_35_11]|uniref:Uncharacterized protein n=1 Tax=Candidatus Campbellbacteria bacterium RIFCSPLOWO2_02_FULL_35_11 TaxID=1797581 RepID=A0A1F5ESK3_9BACT|nr:MAG: hypothetical protein A3I18_02705 [Candidatus Campbellbacteria bacterium RIFCSPLOWO2_02_FULL_35_11]
MGSNIKIRIILNLLIFVSIAIAPWWFSLFLMFLGIGFSFNFYESFLFAFVLDSLYSAPMNIFHGKVFVHLIIIFVVFAFVHWFKRRLRI